jgi:hypothetical protein
LVPLQIQQLALDLTRIRITDRNRLAQEFLQTSALERRQ